MNHRRQLKREIKNKKRWVLVNGTVCVVMFTWFLLEVCFERQCNAANLYQVVGIIYSAACACMLESEIEKLEDELLVQYKAN